MCNKIGNIYIIENIFSRSGTSAQVEKMFLMMIYISSKGKGRIAESADLFDCLMTYTDFFCDVIKNKLYYQ